MAESDRAPLFNHDDMPEHAQKLVYEARENVKGDYASALSAARKVLALAVGQAVPLFTTAELRGLNIAYALMSPPEAVSTIESYAGRAYQDATVDRTSLAALRSTEPAMMHGNVDASMQKTISHSIVRLESFDVADTIQSDTDPVAAATQSWHAPTVGGGELKPVVVGPGNESPSQTAKNDGREPQASSGDSAKKFGSQLSPGDDRLPA